MNARCCFALSAGIAIVGAVIVGAPQSTRAGVPGFAAGGNTAVGAYPVGAATGTDPAVAANGSSKLGIGIPFQTAIIDNYQPNGSCPWVISALQAEGYTAKNGWTINTQALKGNDISLNTYAPWVNNAPAITQGNLSVAASAEPGSGGAAIGIGYNPNAAALAAGDPNPANVNWIQAVATTSPSAFGTGNAGGTANNLGGGFTNYLDNGYLSNAGNNYNGPLPNNPFYGGVNNGTGAYAGNGTANGANFIDEPQRALPTWPAVVQWQAQVFLASWAPNNPPVPATSNTATDVNNASVIAGGGTITLYDGVWWGFQLAGVPEPGTLVIWGTLFGLVISYRAWRGRDIKPRS